jgi:hypothetical protein
MNNTKQANKKYIPYQIASITRIDGVLDTIDCGARRSIKKDFSLQPVPNQKIHLMKIQGKSRRESSLKVGGRPATRVEAYGIRSTVRRADVNRSTFLLGDRV